MTMKAIWVSMFLLLAFPFVSRAQTDASLFFKKDKQTQLEIVESKSGNLFNKLGHHGPAIENPWYGLRIYFDKKAAIDVYSKGRKGLELKEKQWYPTKKEQLEGWGADYYKAGKTVGLGGIKLWDNGQIIDLHPVTNRRAQVWHYGDSASMEMISEGIPYKGKLVDVSVRVTVYTHSREAKVETRSLSGEDLQFVTGINYFEHLEVRQTENYIATWGIHPEDVAAEKIEVGGAIFIPAGSTCEIQKHDAQYILISNPRQKLTYNITTASKREDKYQSMKNFVGLLEALVNEKTH